MWKVSCGKPRHLGTRLPNERGVVKATFDPAEEPNNILTKHSPFLCLTSIDVALEIEIGPLLASHAQDLYVVRGVFNIRPQLQDDLVDSVERGERRLSPSRPARQQRPYGNP